MYLFYSYAARKSPTYDKYNRSNKSASRSTSPEITGQITYITSFGGDDSNEENNKKEEKANINKPIKRIKKKRCVFQLFHVFFDYYLS